MSVPSSTVRPDRATLLAFAGVVLFGGFNAIGVRQTVLELPPFWGAAVRFGAAGLLMAGLAVLRGRPFPGGRSLRGAMLYGAVSFAGSFGLVYVALRDVPASTGSVLIALTPLITFGLAIAQGQERFRAQGLLGALVALGGVAIVFVDQVAANVPIAPLGLIVLGAACIAEGSIIVKRIPRSDPFGTNAVAMLTAGALLLAASLLAGESRAAPTQPATWLALGYLIVFGSVVMFGLYLFALERWTASAVSYTTLLLPFVSVTAATILTGERVSPSLVVGGLVVLAGVYVGAFLHIRPHRSSATSLPECLPVDACAEPSPGALAPAPGRA